MDMLLHDVRFGLRSMLKNRGFSAAAVLTLALGIGANTTIFSVFNATLLRPLGFVNQDRLVIVNETVRRDGLEVRSASYPDFRDWREQSRTLDNLAAFSQESFSLTGGDRPERVPGEIASATYFPLLGVEPLVGRSFLPEEDTEPDAHPVAVLGYGLWQRRFGADPGVVGRSVRVNDADFVVVGVMPEGFRGVSAAADVWIPMAMVSALRPASVLENRTSRWLQVAARLGDGVTVDQARAELDTIAGRLEAAYPGSNANRGVQIVGLYDALTGTIRPTLTLLLAAVAAVLLIACTNVANLVLARAVFRQGEIAVRTALGATRGRLVQQLLTESMILSLLGGAVGLLLAVWSIGLLRSFIGAQIPVVSEISIDGTVLAFTFGVSMLTGVVFGVAPALQSSTAGTGDLLCDAGRRSTGGPHHNRVRRVLVISELTLALVLLVCAGLLIKSLGRLQAFDPGFEAEGVAAARVELPRRYGPHETASFQQRVLERVAALPGVRSTAVVSDIPMSGNTSAMSVTAEGSTPPDAEVRIYRHRISPDYFAAMGIPLLRGRDFTPRDAADTERVVVVSDALAGRLWPGRDPIGMRIGIGDAGRGSWLTVVGVAADVAYRSVAGDADRDPDVYFPILQDVRREFSVVARTDGDAVVLIGMIANEIRGLDPELPVFDTVTMEEVLRRQAFPWRLSALLLSIFAVAAVFLAAVGTYGVAAFSVARRTHEMAIRLALGASQRTILAHLLAESLALVGLGVVFGLASALGAARLVASQLYAVSVGDPVVFTCVALLLAVVAFAASLAAARRALNLDPMQVLRGEQ